MSESRYDRAMQRQKAAVDAGIARADEERSVLVILTGEGKAKTKPKRASLPKGVTLEDVTLEMALKLLALPRTVGLHPTSGKEILGHSWPSIGSRPNAGTCFGSGVRPRYVGPGGRPP